MSQDAQLPDDVPSMTGAVIGGKYRVDRLLGSGGMGTVWLGAHATLGTKVAIKFIRPSHATHVDARKRFEIEARATAKLSTKHAVHVFDYGTTDDGIPYIVMEYLEGESLSERLIREGPMSGLEVARMIRQAARALTKAHAAGIVHRDLKPDNIFLCSNVDDTGDDYGYIVKLVDFGIAKIFQEPLVSDRVAMPMGGPTMEGAVIGTPNFMSPEQLTLGGMPGALTDLWSLGACAFAAMTARIPFEGDVLGDIVLKVCASPLPVASRFNPAVPPGFDEWFARACSRDAKKRFQTPEELAAALDRVCGVVRASSPSLVDDTENVQYRLKPATPEALAALDEMEEPQSMSSRTAMLAGIVLTVALGICVLGVMAYRDKLKSEETAPPAPSALPAPPASK
jgi:serine/threonine-protein kinase